MEPNPWQALLRICGYVDDCAAGVDKCEDERDWRELQQELFKANSAQNYRYWVIWRCPSVRYFDFIKVRDVERKKAAELFGSADEPTDLASKVRRLSQTVMVLYLY